MKHFGYLQFVLIAWAFPFLSLQAQEENIVDKIMEIEKTDNQVMRHLDILTNRFGGRITGSDNYTHAAQWAYNEFKKWGLEAELDEVGEVTVGFNRGPWVGKMVSPEEKNLRFGTPSYTAGTKGVQQGHVVIYHGNKHQWDEIKDKVKGAWVLIEGENNGWARDRFVKSKITKKLENAGAIGTIQSSPDPIRVMDSRATSWDSLPGLPDIKLLDTQYNEIKSWVESGKEVILEFDIRNYFYPGPVKYYNVIASIPGTQYPNEYVIIGAHLDSYDGATGAVDNGSGVAPAMEVARLLMKAGAKPKRTIMFHLWAAEERGLIGSASWVKRNKEKLPRISAVFNRDYGTNAIVGLGVPQSMKKDFEKIIKPVANVNPEYPFTLEERKGFIRNGKGSTDTHSFLMEGVPAFNWDNEGVHKYSRIWHTLYDTYNEVIPEYQEHSTLVIALVALGVANLDHLLPRDDIFYPDGVYTTLYTNKGKIFARLDYDKAPVTVSNFIGLAEGTLKNEAKKEGERYFDGTVFHRVAKGHVIQGGSPDGTSDGGPGYVIPNEIHPELTHHKEGILGMANSGPHTNGSQFYITLAERSYLDGDYTVFGEVLDGMDVVHNIEKGDTLNYVRIHRVGDEAQNIRPDTLSFPKMIKEARERINNEQRIKEEKEEQKIRKNWPGLQIRTDSIKYEVLKAGEGDKPSKGAIVKVKYSGFFLWDESPFANTKESGTPQAGKKGEVFEYKVGESFINPGLDIIIPDMTKGEKRRVILPSHKAYGKSGFYGKSVPGKKRFVIRPNTTLVYELEILDIK